MKSNNVEDLMNKIRSAVSSTGKSITNLSHWFEIEVNKLVNKEKIFTINE